MDAPPSRTRFLAAASLTGLVLVLYGRVVRLPYVGDDWEFLYWATRPLGRAVSDAFRPTGQLMYRPLTRLYFWVLERAFGLEVTVPHVIALGLTAAAAIAVMGVARRLTGDRTVAWAVGLTVAAAITILQDPLEWISGVQDLATLPLVFFAVSLHLEGRYVRSASAFAVALLFKEVAVILLPTLLIVAPRRARGLVAHGLVLAVYAALKLQGRAPVAGVYRIAWSGPHLAMHARLASRWIAEAWVPQSVVPAALLTVAATLGFGLRKEARRGALALALVAIVAVLPVFFLMNQFYRYYLLYALPWIAIYWWTGLASLLGRRFGVRAVQRAVAVVAVAGALSAVPFAWSGREPTGGVNDLADAAALVVRVRGALAADRPPHGAVLVFDDPPFAVGFDAGPQLWLADPTITAVARGAPLPPAAPVWRWQVDRFVH